MMVVLLYEVLYTDPSVNHHLLNFGVISSIDFLKVLRSLDSATLIATFARLFCCNNTGPKRLDPIEWVQVPLMRLLWEGHVKDVH